MYRSTIIGAGPSGLHAAIHLAKAGLKPLVINGTEPCHLTTDVRDNRLKQPENFGADYRYKRVIGVDLSKRPFAITMEGQQEVQAETLIITNGIKAEYLSVPRKKEHFDHEIRSSTTHQDLFFRNKQVIVISGDDTAIVAVEALTQNASKVTVVHREAEVHASKYLLNRVRENRDITWMLNRSPIEILGDNRGVIGLKVINHKTGREEVIPADGIYVASGMRLRNLAMDRQPLTDSLGWGLWLLYEHR